MSSSLPSPTHFSVLDVNAATDTLFSTLTSCLDHICPLSSKPARAVPSNPWSSGVLHEHRSKLRAAGRKWHKSKDPSDLSIYQSLFSSFSAEVHTVKTSYFHNKINNTSCNLFKTFNSLLCPPLQPPYNMPSWSNPLTPSPSYLSFTLTSIRTHNQHISPHRHLPNCIQAGSGNPTAQRTYIKHFT